MFQTLKFLPAQIGPIDGELLGLGLFGLGAAAWVFIPWIDRSEGSKMATVFRAIGGAIVLFIAVMTALGYILK